MSAPLPLVFVSPAALSDRDYPLLEGAALQFQLRALGIGDPQFPRVLEARVCGLRPRRPKAAP